MMTRLGFLMFAMAPIMAPMALLVPAAPGKKAAPAIRPLETFVNSVGMRFALVPAGDFLMGSPESDTDAMPDEKPQHKVRITKIYGVGLTHVTVGDFKKFTQATKFKTAAERQGSAWRAIRFDGKLIAGDKCHWRDPGFPVTDEHPVVNVDYDDAIAFCEWLSKEEGQVYRLPTEAEWEYCCRATTTTRWSCGDDPDDLLEHARIHIPAFPKYARTNSPAADGWLFFAPVAQYKANPWGLFDMHGNL